MSKKAAYLNNVWLTFILNRYCPLKKRHLSKYKSVVYKVLFLQDVIQR